MRALASAASCTPKLCKSRIDAKKSSSNSADSSKTFDRKPALEALNGLRYILHQLNCGLLQIDDLKRNIEYAALILETAYMDENRRICGQDSDLSEVSSNIVPDEIREWLAETFSKQPVTKRDTPKFKSVANAIRTGIFFDKFFRKTQYLTAPIPAEIADFLKMGIDLWSFNCFELHQISDGHALKYMGFELFHRYNFIKRFKIPWQALECFLLSLEEGYSKHNNPYHNIVHATDVAQSAHFMLSQTGLANLLDDIELLAVIFAACIHDYEHTGHTNSFHVKSGSDFALLYNDRSVLENHHVSASFRLLKDADKNILSRLTNDEYREFRNLVIEIVLATDMSTHFMQVKTIKGLLVQPENIDKTKALCLVVHACDISHASKPWKLHTRWTEGVLEEFFRQGDLEASMNLSYTPLCDRHTVCVAESQIGFIDFIVEPTMSICSEMLLKMIQPLVLLPPSEIFLTKSNQNRDSFSSDSRTLNTVRKLPLNNAGKLEIPNPWVAFMNENKSQWKSKAAKELIVTTAIDGSFNSSDSLTHDILLRDIISNAEEVTKAVKRLNIVQNFIQQMRLENSRVLELLNGCFNT